MPQEAEEIDSDSGSEAEVTAAPAKKKPKKAAGKAKTNIKASKVHMRIESRRIESSP